MAMGSGERLEKRPPAGPRRGNFQAPSLFPAFAYIRGRRRPSAKKGGLWYLNPDSLFNLINCPGRLCCYMIMCPKDQHERTRVKRALTMFRLKFA